MPGDVRDPEGVHRAMEGVEAVFHLAAAVGAGQSMYEIDRWTSVNSLGTAVLMKALAERPGPRLVVASSMSVYGEGLYRRVDGGRVPGRSRPRDRLEAGDWELADEQGRPLEPVPTPEDKPPELSSVYALTKYDQEQMSLLLGRAYRFPVTALRFFNTYGPRQALSNPYTGVMAIFAGRLLGGRGPIIYEDGRQQRDFVSVHDVARACRLALDAPRVRGEVINIGSGRPVTVLEVARRTARILGREHIRPIVSGEYRAGDIRHCYADIGRARRLLGYEPRVSLEDGLTELAEWLSVQDVSVQDVSVQDAWGPQRLAAGHPAFRGRRGRRLPDHGRLGGHRALPGAGARVPGGPQRGRGGRAGAVGFGTAGPEDRPGGHGTGAQGAHLPAPRGAVGPALPPTAAVFVDRKAGFSYQGMRRKEPKLRR